MNVYDLLYGIGLLGSAPVWAARADSRAKVMTALRQRMGHVEPRKPDRPAVWVHAVSLGEVNAARALIEGLLKDANQPDVILSTTTSTGHDRSVTLYGANPRVLVVRYPLDFSSAIRRSLDALRPSAVVLMELETWPNFILQCHRRRIPVFVVNGRVTEGSFRKYRWVKPIISRMLSRLEMICAQDTLYAERFIALGAPREKVQVTGTMKYDTADVTDSVPGADALASELSLNGEDPIWVCGSTGPGEEALLLGSYRKLLSTFPHLRLVLVPRKPERFDEAEEIIRANEMNVIRRSEGIDASQRQALERYCVPPVILGDTMGELRKFYSLATVVFVGRSLVDLGSRQHGSDMIEPAALGKPCVVGPFTGNFDEAVRSLKAGQGIVEIRTAADLEAALSRLLNAPSDASEMGRRAQAVIESGKGATAATLDDHPACIDSAGAARLKRSTMQRPILSYPRKFVPALAWSVRGAMLQLGGSLSIVDDDGAVVYEARANTRLTFAAIVLGLIAIGVLVGPTIIAIKWPTWMRRDTQPICTAFGAIALFLSLACYWISTQSLAVLLIENGTAIASLRRRPAVRTRLWEARSPSGQELGRVISNDTQILIFTPENRLVLTVASHLLPGVSQASWRQITIPGGAKGRLRIGLGAGSRLEIDDSIHAIDHPLLAALLLIVAIQGK